jgi:hypothetical protein
VVSEPLRQALGSSGWRARQDGLASALRILNTLQHQVGLPAVDDPVVPFFDRLYLGVRDELIERLEASVASPEVRALPRGVGSVEQWSHNVDVLMDPRRRLSTEPA